MRIGLILALAILCLAATPAPPAKEWQRRLTELLPLMGHRNWIVVVDSAYPLQMSGGIETLYTGEDQLPVVKKVLSELGKQKHVSPIVYLDQELKFVGEVDAKGIGAYRRALSGVLGKRQATAMAHEEIIKMLDEAGKTFKVLVLKTKLTLPYTSVFLRLDCGYWGAEKEKKMRAGMGGK